jgi:WhiB family transcriptional regulator, redox-sensing transcriptional regulator
VSLRALLDSTAAGTGQTVDPIPCLTQDADLWFSDSPSEVEEAKRLCRDCPVRHECLADAMERHEAAGVWGGELFMTGVVVPFKRPRGRPPRSAGAASLTPATPRRPRPAPTTTEVPA